MIESRALPSYLSTHSFACNYNENVHVQLYGLAVWVAIHSANQHNLVSLESSRMTNTGIAVYSVLETKTTCAKNYREDCESNAFFELNTHAQMCMSVL